MKNVYALIVGINEYPSPNELEGCVNDSVAIEEYLQANYNQTYEYNLSIQKLLNKDATRENIIDGFRNFLGKAVDGDVCLFYYTGHGAFMNAPTNLYTSDSKCQTLVCYFDDIANRDDLIDKELGSLVYEITNTKNIHFVAITDCCHSGTMFKNVDTRDKMYRDANTAEARQLKDFIGYNEANKKEGKIFFNDAAYIHIGACSSEEKAIETTIGNNRHGVLTSSIIKTLTDFNGNISYTDLVQQAYLFIRQYTKSQHPRLNVELQTSTLSRAKFLDSSIFFTTPVPVINYIDRDWVLNKGLVDNVNVGDKIFLQNGGLTTGSCDAKVIAVQLATATLQKNNTSLDRAITNQPVRIEPKDGKAHHIGIAENVPSKIKTAILNSRYLAALENIEIVAEKQFYNIEFDEKQRLCFKNNCQEEYILFTDENITEIATDKIDLFVDWIDKYLHAIDLLKFRNSSNPVFENKYKIALQVKEINNDTFKTIESLQNIVALQMQQRPKQYPQYKIEITNTGDFKIYINTAYIEYDYAISTNIFRPLEIAAGQTAYLEVTNFSTRLPREITQLYLTDEMIADGITTIEEQLKLFITDIPIDLSTQAQEGINSKHCRTRGATKRAIGNNNWAVENIDFKISVA
jgi:hypothetical protein